MGGKELMNVVKQHQKVERLTLDLAGARIELWRALKEAHDSGETVSELARRLGVTRQRVYQLLEKR